jgi:4'-phosphopantetheinyl transferase
MGTETALLPLTNQVHVWVIESQVIAGHAASLAALLNEDERASYIRSVQARRLELLASRSVLRSIVADYCGSRPAEVEKRIGTYGKPSIDYCPFQFSISHSAGIAVIAFFGAPIGIDIEKIREVPVSLDEAKTFLAPFEQAMLQQIKPENRSAAFFKVWTCKEAIAKEDGRGLRMEFDSFAVCCNPATLPRIIIPGRLDANLRLLNVSGDVRLQGFAVNLASRSEVTDVKYHTWLPPFDMRADI